VFVGIERRYMAETKGEKAIPKQLRLDLFKKMLEKLPKSQLAIILVISFADSKFRANFCCQKFYAILLYENNFFKCEGQIVKLDLIGSK